MFASISVGVGDLPSFPTFLIPTISNFSLNLFPNLISKVSNHFAGVVHIGSLIEETMTILFTFTVSQTNAHDTHTIEATEMKQRF